MTINGFKSVNEISEKINIPKLTILYNIRRLGLVNFEILGAR